VKVYNPKQLEAGIVGAEETENKKMDSTALRAMQAPIKDRYKSDPKAAFITLKAKGSLDS